MPSAVSNFESLVVLAAWLSISVLFLALGAFLNRAEERYRKELATKIDERKQRIAQVLRETSKLESEIAKQVEEIRLLGQRIDEAAEDHQRSQAGLALTLSEQQEEETALKNSPEFTDKNTAESACQAIGLEARKARDDADAALGAKQRLQKWLSDKERELEKAATLARAIEQDLRSHSIEKKRKAEADMGPNRDLRDRLVSEINKAASELAAHATKHDAAQEHLAALAPAVTLHRDKLRAASHLYDIRASRHSVLTRNVKEQKERVSSLSRKLLDLQEQRASRDKARISSERALRRKKLELEDSASDLGHEDVTTDVALTGRHGWLAVLMFTGLAAVLAIYCTVDPEWTFLPGATPERAVTLFGVASGGVLMSFTKARSTAGFYSNFGMLMILYGPLVVSTLFRASLLMQLALIAVALAASFMASGERSSGPGGGVNILYTLWIVTGVFATAYKHGFLPSPTEQAQTSEMASLLTNYFRRLDNAVDIRIAATVLLLMAVIVKAITVAFQLMPSPRIGHLPRLPQIPAKTANGASVFSAFVEPFLITYNLLIRIAHSVLDTLWYIMATVIVYLARIGKSMGNIIFEATSKTKIWPNTLRLLGCYALVYWFCRGVANCGGPAIRYLRQDLRLLDLLPKLELWDIGVFIIATLVTLVGGICYVWLSWPEENMRTYLHREAFGTAVGLVIHFSAGMLVYTVASTRLIRIQGFDHIGPFTYLVALLLIIIAGGQLALRISKRAT